MNRRILLDTGPLVALLNGRDEHHDWARFHWAQTEPPLLTCEAVLSEACFLLRGAPRGNEAVFELVRRRVVQIAFHLEDHLEAVTRLLRKYANVPMSLADGCLVRMAELSAESAILTLDNDFRLYRKNGRHVVPVVMPE
jgi:predicted nucleic acid-binding protein